MAINPSLIEIKKVTELVSKLPFLQAYFAHCGEDGVLYKATLDQLANFLAPYITAIGGSGFVGTTGTVLPAASAGKFTIVGAGTFTQTTGGNVVTTELINILGSSATTWSLVKAIPLPNVALKTDLQYKGTFDTLALAIAGVPLASRKLGDTVGIKENGKVVEYWWESVTTNSGLVVKYDSKNLIRGKRLLLEGDSLFELGLVSSQIVAQTGCTLANAAVGGTGYVWKHNTGTNIRTRVVNTTGIYDFAIFWGGTNDYGNGVPLGSSTVLNDDNQFYSAVYNTFRVFREMNPTVPTLIATPLQRFQGVEVRGNKNSIGLTLQDYANVLKEVAAMFSIGVIDILSASKITYENITLYTSDGVHPNTTGATLLATEFSHAIDEILKGAVMSGNGSVKVINNTSVGGAKDAFSAQQGKYLADGITGEAIRDKGGVLSNLKPSGYKTYNDFPDFGNIDATTGLITLSGSNATRRHSGMVKIPEGVDIIRFANFAASYRYQFYDAAGAPIFPNGLTNVITPLGVAKPSGAEYFIVGVYNPTAAVTDYTKLFYGYQTDKGFTTKEYVDSKIVVSDSKILDRLNLQHSNMSGIGSGNIDQWSPFDNTASVTLATDGGIKLLDNFSGLETQAKIRSLFFKLQDNFTVYMKVKFLQLNNSYNMDILDGIINGYGETNETGDDSVNKSGFSFTPIHPTLSVRPIFSIVKAIDFDTSGNIEIWRIIKPPTFKAGFERIWSGTAIPIGSIFDMKVEYEFNTLTNTDYYVSITVNNVKLVNRSLMGMISVYAGNGSLLFQCKGTAEEPAEYEVKELTVKTEVENGNFMTELITRLF